MTEATTHIPAPPDELNPRQAAFCEAYVSGPTSGNGTASYRAAGYKPQRDNAAATAASRLLRDVHVIEYIGALRRAAAANVVDNLSSWAEAEPAARAIVIQIAKGEIPADPRVRVKAAQYIADRALGKPKQAVEVDGHISSADQAIKALSEELAEYDRRIAEEDATNGNGAGQVGPIDAKSEPRGRR